jgi:hypothetical protein
MQRRLTAAIEAAMHADNMLQKGDLDGQATWLRVLAAIKEMQSEEPPDCDVTVH